MLENKVCRKIAKNGKKLFFPGRKFFSSQNDFIHTIDQVNLTRPTALP